MRRVLPLVALSLLFLSVSSARGDQFIQAMKSGQARVDLRYRYEAIEPGYLVALGERRIIEHGVDKVVDRATQSQDRLADV